MFLRYIQEISQQNSLDQLLFDMTLINWSIDSQLTIIDGQQHRTASMVKYGQDLLRALFRTVTVL